VKYLFLIIPLLAGCTSTPVKVTDYVLQTFQNTASSQEPMPTIVSATREPQPEPPAKAAELTKTSEKSVTVTKKRTVEKYNANGKLQSKEVITEEETRSEPVLPEVHVLAPKTVTEKVSSWLSEWQTVLTMISAIIGLLVTIAVGLLKLRSAVLPMTYPDAT
jgi:hypothetical protein